MKISLISRPNQNIKWGGDLGALQLICQGLSEVGVDASILPSVFDITDEDHIIISNTVHDLRSDYKVLALMQRPYSIIGFHENYLQYFTASTGFYHYGSLCVSGEDDVGVETSIDRLKEHPDIVYYYGAAPKKCPLVNAEVLEKAAVCIANSPTERATMLRDSPRCNAKSVFWPPGFKTSFSEKPTDAFLSLTGLKSKDYLLQVGRLEFRKNQLGTIFATKDLDIPLVFIATRGNLDWYEKRCIEAILKLRKAPTVIVAEALEPMQQGCLRVIPMPGADKLPVATLHSAFYHAAVNIHPAFQELPGFTYLESLATLTPTIASSWTTISDYLQGDDMNGLIQYTPPHDIARIERLVVDMISRKIEPPKVLPDIFYQTPKKTAESIYEHILSASGG